MTIRDGRVTGELHGANGRRWVFVDDGGLIRLDPDDLRTAGIAGAAEVAIGPGAVVLRAGRATARVAHGPSAAPTGRARAAGHVRRRFGTQAEVVDAVAGRDAWP